MRWGLVLLGLLAVGCEARFGAYLTIDGDPRQIRFDRVELYFGTATEATTMSSPKMFKETNAKVFARQFEQQDIAEVMRRMDGTKATETTYWLPHDEKSGLLGAYVMAVAYDGPTAVGVGEQFNFEIKSDVVYSYDIELEPYVVPFTTDLVDQWGDAPGCIAWRRNRGDGPKTIAVVKSDDHDCDQLLATQDCDDAGYCPGLDCDVRNVCGTSTTCALGCPDLVLGCRRDTCIFPGACEPGAWIPEPMYCDKLSGKRDDKLSCGIDVGHAHTEVTVQTQTQTGLCARELFVPAFGHPCSNPAIEFVDPRGMGDGFTFTVSDGGATGGTSYCIVRIVDPVNDPLAEFGSDHHIVISFDPPNQGPRWSFIVGIAAQPTPDPCSATMAYNVVPGGTVDDCLP